MLVCSLSMAVDLNKHVVADYKSESSIFVNSSHGKICGKFFLSSVKVLSLHLIVIKGDIKLLITL